MDHHAGRAGALMGTEGIGRMTASYEQSAIDVLKLIAGFYNPNFEDPMSDDDFFADDYAAGNTDDAYFAGRRHGEGAQANDIAILARDFLQRIGELD